jgi:hypothetical protein
MFQVLVEHGADMTVADNQGRTLLMMAWEQGNSVIAADILTAWELSGCGNLRRRSQVQYHFPVCSQ